MKPSLLYTTDFYYQASGRNYYEENLRITGFLMNYELLFSLPRLDACRLPDGRLLLVELEDLNPYLSLDLLEK